MCVCLMNFPFKLAGKYYKFIYIYLAEKDFLHHFGSCLSEGLLHGPQIELQLHKVLNALQFGT